MDLSTSWKRAEVSEIAGFQPPVYWVSANSLIVGSCCIFQLPRKMSEFEDVCAGWLQDCTSPGKTFFARGPWIIALLQGWFCVGIQSLVLPLLKGGSLQVVAHHKLARQQDTGQGTVTHSSVTAGLVQGQWVCSPVLMMVLPSMTESLQRASPFIGSLGEIQGGLCIVTGEGTERRGRAEGLHLAAGWALVVSPSPAATCMGGTSSWGHSGPSCCLSPTNSTGFTTVSHLCSLE